MSKHEQSKNKIDYFKSNIKSKHTEDKQKNKK
jgi:hypothetical protein